jgi:hypothetical protein
LYFYLPSRTKPFCIMLKKYCLLSRLIIAIVLPVLLFSVGCQDTNDEPGNDNYRTIQAKYYTGNVLSMVADYHYTGERLSEMLALSAGPEPDTVRAVFEYPDENSMVWNEFPDTRKTECSFLNGKMTQYLEYFDREGTWELRDKYTYEYINGNLSEEIWSTLSGGVLTPLGKLTYEYDGNKVIRSIGWYHSTDWQLGDMEEAFYEGDKIIKIVRSAYDDSTYVEYYHIDLIYDGSLITGYNYYKAPDDELMVSYTFTYDEHGNLESRESVNGSDIMKTEYFYEPGIGNYEQFRRPGGGIDSHIAFPKPTI